MRRLQLHPTLKCQLKFIGIGLGTFLIFSGAACPPATQTPPPIKVTERHTLTLTVNGDPEPATFYVAGNQHRYQVEVKVELLTENANFDPPDTGVSIIWIDPFSQREEYARVNLKSGTTNIYSFILPKSENLDLCQPCFTGGLWCMIWWLGIEACIWVKHAMLCQPENLFHRILFSKRYVRRRHHPGAASLVYS